MYDFDKLFTDFLKAKGHVHEDEFNEVYNEWLISPSAVLGGTPKDIISAMSDGELIEELKEECLVGTPSLVVMETLERRAPIARLTQLLYEDNETLVYCAAELLRNLDSSPLNVYIELLPSIEDEELFELVVSALKENPDLYRDKLLELATNSDMRIKTVVGEILSEGGKDERVYRLLGELFASGDNLPLYASYLAHYGDERAVSMLYRALSSASYADYIEIRNAIETLGGIVDEEMDFSSDPEYIYLKEKSSGNQ